MDTSKLNLLSLQRIKDYREVDVFGTKVSTPYYINNIENYILQLMREEGVDEEKIRAIHKRYSNNEVNYGWHRGKGTPEEIREDIIELSQRFKFILQGANPESILEIMKFFGLGIDCSGFVYNVLEFAFDQVGEKERFIQSLDWADRDKIGVMKAGTFVFGENASIIIDKNDVGPLDLILFKGTTRKYTHIALVVEDKGKLYTAQSTITSYPTGVTISLITPKEEYDIFHYSPQTMASWNNLYEEGSIEFRRMKCLL